LKFLELFYPGCFNGRKGEIEMDELGLLKNKIQAQRLEAQNQLFVAENDGYSAATTAYYKGRVEAFDDALKLIEAESGAEDGAERPSDGAQ